MHDEPVTRYQVERLPLYFDSTVGESLFGWYHAPVAGCSDLAVAICPPLGHEYVSSYRSLRHLADRLASAGVPALRFDYHGVGNSAGFERDPDRLAVWQDNVRDALAALRSLSGCNRLGLIGLRMGATVAALLSAQSELSCAVLWAPCIRGRTYVREMKAMHMAGDYRTSSAPSATGEVEAGGFLLTEQTISHLDRVDLSRVVPKAQRVLIVERDDLSQDFALRDAWQKNGANVEQRRLPGYVDMLAASHATIVPHDALREIVEWISADSVADKNKVVSPSRAPVFRASQFCQLDRLAEDANLKEDEALRIRESPMQFGTDGKLFGILSEPSTAADPMRPTILLLNSGSVHHAGPNRLYVSLARQMARLGFRCLRMDFSGLGDSVVDDPTKENIPYLATASAEAAAAIAELQRGTDGRAFVLMGLCSGAHAAFHAALDLTDLPIVECVLINPLTFYYQDGMSLDEPKVEHFSEWRWYMNALWDVGRWSRLIRGKSNFGDIFGLLQRRSQLIASKFTDALRDGWARYIRGVIKKDQLEVDIGRLIGAGRQLTFVFARSDPGYDLLMSSVSADIKHMLKRGRVPLFFIEHADHTFSTRIPRQAMISSITQHLSARYPDALAKNKA